MGVTGSPVLPVIFLVSTRFILQLYSQTYSSLVVVFLVFCNSWLENKTTNNLRCQTPVYNPWLGSFWSTLQCTTSWLPVSFWLCLTGCDSCVCKLSHCYGKKIRLTAGPWRCPDLMLVYCHAALSVIQTPTYDLFLSASERFQIMILCPLDGKLCKTYIL